jgi:D-alanyl-D-alanine carboxypeptidase
MRWFFSLFTRRHKPRISRGLFIPGAAPLPALAPDRSLMLRPVTALVVVSSFCFFVYAQASTYVNARLTQPASPVVVTMSTWPYQAAPLVVGPNRELADPSFFNNLKNELIQSTNSLVAIDARDNTLTVYQAGQEILETRYLGRATANSWRHIPAGYYQVERVRNERYSSLEQAYYQHVLQLNQRMAIHGPATKNTGAELAVPSLGFTLSATDAASVATLVRPGTPVLVHVPTASTESTTLTPRGPTLPVRSYLAYDLATDNLLVAHEPDRVVPIASLTKLMTALVVTEAYDLEGEIAVDQERYVTTLVPRLPGTYQTSVYDLLQLLLLESSNEAAEVLATHTGRDAFIATMNDRAAQLGLTNTTFTDPSGLDNGNQSTARDIERLVRYLYEHHPYILRMSAIENAVAAARTNDFRDLENFNPIDGLTTFVGGKIGETEAARQTSATIHELSMGDTVRPVVLVVLGSEARNDDVTTLHDYLLAQYAE